MWRAEIRKLSTTRGPFGLLAAASVVTALSAMSTTSQAAASSLAEPLHTHQLFLLTSINLGLFALILGMRAFTDEFRHGTIASTLLVTDRRGRVVAAKAVAAAAGAAVMATVAQAVMVLVAVLSASTRGATIGLSAADLGAAVRLGLVTAAWAVIGVAMGALIRQPVAAVAAGLVWVLVVENLFSGLLPGAGRLLPGQAAHALAGVTAVPGLLDPWAAGGLLALYVGVAGLAAVVTLGRRDVPLPD
jgi:ABC-2 type transport system permease protein